MLAKIVKEITHISENENINLENYMEALNFINNIYFFVNKIKNIVPPNNIIFAPSFKGRMTCEKFNISSTDIENEMRCFITISKEFLEEKKEELKYIFEPNCEIIDFEGEKITFILR